MKKRILWTSNPKFWLENIREDRHNSGLSEEELWEIATRYVDFDFSDTVANLSECVCAGDIVCIADLGLWNGRRDGYKTIGRSVGDCFYSHCGDVEYYVDERKNLRAVDHHHDGTNYYLFRALKPTLSDRQIDTFLNLIYEGKCTPRDITRYTVSVGKEVARVYGW